MNPTQTYSIFNRESNYSALYLKDNRVIITANILSMNTSIIGYNGETSQATIRMVRSVTRELADRNKNKRLVNRLATNENRLKPRKLFPHSETVKKSFIDFNKTALDFLEMVDGMNQEFANQENRQK